MPKTREQRHARQLIIKLTAGVESPEKLSQAFTVAATAVASGATVSLWLTGESAWLATQAAEDSDEVSQEPVIG